MTEEAQATQSIETPEAPVAKPDGAAPELSYQTETTATPEPDHSANVGRPESLFAQSEVKEGSEEKVDYARPEWLPEKFKSPEDLGKSYQELEKKLGSFKGAPEEYALEVSEELSPYNYESDNAFVKDFQNIMKEHNVSQELYQKISDCHLGYLKAEDESIQSAKTQQYERDVTNLGEEGINGIKEATKWAKEMLPEDSYSLLSELGDYDVTVGKIVKQFYDAFRNKDYTHLPTGSVMTNSVEDKKIEARSMMADPRYGKDDLFTKRVDGIYKELYA